MLAPADPKTRRAAPAGDPVATSNQQQQQGIKLPTALQALRDEIRILDRYVRNGQLNQLDCDARLDEWRIEYPPGMYRYHRLAVEGVWQDDEAANIIVRGWETGSKREPVKRPKEYRPAQSTIDAFWYLVRLKEPTRLAAWLEDHPKEKSYLLKLLETSNADR